MKLSEIKSVSQKIEQGAWVRDLPNLPGVAVKVRGYGNTDYRRVLLKLRGELSQEQLKDDAAQDAVQVRLLHETILEDWSGIEDAAYSPALAQKLLSDPDLAVFRSGVEYAAGVVARDGQIALEADAKN